MSYWIDIEATDAKGETHNIRHDCRDASEAEALFIGIGSAVTSASIGIKAIRLMDGPRVLRSIA